MTAATVVSPPAARSLVAGPRADRDAFDRHDHGRTWHDRGLAVERVDDAGPDVVGGLHVQLEVAADHLHVRYRLRGEHVDNGVVARLVAAWPDAGPPLDAGLLGRVVIGIVRTAHPGPATVAWGRFHAATLRRLAAPRPAGGDDVDAFGRIHQRAIAAVRGRRVLDVGSCLGFLPLLLARSGHEVVASDRDVAACRLVAAVADELDTRLSVLGADAVALPLADAGVDTVTAVHLLEHLDVPTGERVIAELCRVAARRVVVAVPYEAVPDRRYGHVRAFDDRRLHTLGAGPRAAGWSSHLAHGDGGWLILDRPGPT